MEPTTAVAIGLLAVGLLAVAGLALIAVVRAVRRRAARRASARPGLDPGTTSAEARTEPPGAVRRPPGAASSPPGPTLLRPTRIVVVGDLSPATGPHATAPAELVHRIVDPPTDPRRRLLRDASAALILMAVVVLVATSLPRGTEPEGGVLSATATPASGSIAPGDPSSSPAAARSTGAESSPAAAPFPASASAPVASAPASAPVASAPAPVASAPAPASTSPSPTGPSASRLALLQACPGRRDCYLYVVRTGDTLLRISNFFGIPMGTILRLNPGITDPSIVVRRTTMVFPTPTR